MDLSARHSFVHLMKIMSLAVLLWLGRVVTAGSALADSPSTVAQRVESRYNNLKTLSASFREEYSFGGRRRPAESGTLLLQKKGNMRWDYTRPAGKLFIVHGDNAILYTAATHRVEKSRLRETDDFRAPLAFLLGKLDLRKEFKDLQTEPGAEGTWLTCHAKSDRLPYAQVRLLVAADDSIHQISISGSNGAVTHFDFWGERVNVPVPPQTFEFAIPPGTEVVDTPQLGAEAK